MASKDDKKTEKLRIEGLKKEEKKKQEEIKRLDKERQAAEKLAMKAAIKLEKQLKKQGKKAEPEVLESKASAPRPLPVMTVQQKPAVPPQITQQSPPIRTTTSQSSLLRISPVAANRQSLRASSPPSVPSTSPPASPVKKSSFVFIAEHPPPKMSRKSSAEIKVEVEPLVEKVDALETSQPEIERESIGTMRGANSIENAQYLTQCISELRERMTLLWDDGTNNGYQEAYQALSDVGRDQTSDASEYEPNKLKNRYGNITAYDNTRVVLPVINEDPYTDYVNANYIGGYKHPKAYIAAQGPVPNSFISFWRMVWYEKIETIVMVTNEYEGGKLKCHRYWPDPSSVPATTRQQYGALYVDFESVSQFKNYAIRTFRISCEGLSRVVRHFYYQSWPDHGVPLTTNELLVFRNAVKAQVTNPNVPILIHCSAGVGRTGTYIAIDQLVEQCLTLNGTPDVDDIVYKMRMCRNYMVQTEMQYVFIYRAVLDALTELLEDESSKAQRIAAAEVAEREYQDMLQSAANVVVASRQEHEREDEEIDAARREYLARVVTSADNARELVKGNGIKERLRAIKESEKTRFEEYKRYLEEWNDRNRIEAEIYDLSSALSPVQSRLEALRQKGLLG